MLDLVAAFIALTTLLTYVNYRFIRLPPTIGVMATALVFSLIVQGFRNWVIRSLRWRCRKSSAASTSPKC